MSKSAHQLNESYDRVIQKFNEIDDRMETIEYLIIGLYALIPLMVAMGWFF
jgi:hypothetical protein